MRARRRESATPVLGALVWTLIAGLAAGQNTFTTSSYEQFFTGTLIEGSHLDTHADDGICESIEETETGGKPSKRTSKLEHLWGFTLPAGSAHTFHFKAGLTDSGEGDAIELLWSDDDQTYTPLLTYGVGDSGTIRSAPLPPGLSGMLLIWMQDADRTKGNRVLDTFSIDWMCVETAPQGGPPPVPPAPTNLRTMDLSPYEILISWEDNATTEDGYRVQRSLDTWNWTLVATLDANATRFQDTGLLPATTYHYTVSAFSAAGESPPSNVATATTRPLGAYGITFIDAVSGTLVEHDHHPLTGWPGIAYSSSGDDAIRFAEYDGQSWNIEIVGLGAWGLSFAYAPSGVPSICHLIEEDLRYLERIGGTWVAQVIDIEVLPWDYTSLAYDSTGEPGITYNKQVGPKTQQGLYLARRAAGVWTTELVDSRAVARYSSLAFDSQGHPAIAGAGDVDGDGFGDFIIGAQGLSQTGPNSAGHAQVYSGATGLVLRTFYGSSGDYFGYAVARAGDVNGDGFDDVVIGAPQWGSGPYGYARVFSPQTNAMLLHIPGTPSPSCQWGLSGWSVACAGDVNGDGKADILVGNPMSCSGMGGGSVTVHSGADASVLFTLTGSGNGDGMGFAVAGLGDVNGDNVPDVAGAAGPYTLVASGASTGTGSLLHTLGVGNKISALGDVDGDGVPDVVAGYGAQVFSLGGIGGTLGNYSTVNPYTSVAGIGDVNGDGIPDLAVGETDGTRVWVILMGIGYQQNSALAALQVNGLQGSANIPAGLTLSASTISVLALSSNNPGMPWELGLGFAPLVPQGAGASTTVGGQIFNLDLTDPTLMVLWSCFQSPGFANVTMPFWVPPPASLSTQMLVVAPTMPSGVAISQPVRLVVP